MWKSKVLDFFAQWFTYNFKWEIAEYEKKIASANEYNESCPLYCTTNS